MTQQAMDMYIKGFEWGFVVGFPFALLSWGLTAGLRLFKIK